MEISVKRKLIKMYLNQNRKALLSILAIFLTFTCQDLIARPDFDVHPRNIEHRLRAFPAIRDNMDVDNNAGDEVLVWSLEVLPEGGEWPDGVEWLTVSRNEGEVNPNRDQRIVVTLEDDDLGEGHFYADLFFTTNDPTREEYTVPVAAHTVDYAQITTGWPNEWGGWWGVDMNNIFGDIAWGDTPSIQLRIRNPGSAELTVDEVVSSNGFWELDTSEFDLDPDGSILIRFTFLADEVGPNSTTITSESNAWDPRELNFRIIAAVDPTFRMGVEIPDIEIDEDIDNLLIVDLDSIFISSDRGIDFEVEAENLSWEINRSHEFFLSPDENWNGITNVIISTSREDSVLVDTFQVTVTPIPDAPSSFDMLAPLNGDTIRWDAIDDSMFIWQQSFTVDGDTISYTVLFFGNDTTIAVEAFNDTTASYAILDQFLNIENGGTFRWKVRANGDSLSRDSWSTFTNYALPTAIKSGDKLVPTATSLVDIFPNPFNNTTTIRVNLSQAGHIKLSIYDQLGREIIILEEKALSIGQHVYHWQPQNLVSGNYILKLETEDKIYTYKIGLIK